MARQLSSSIAPTLTSGYGRGMEQDTARTPASHINNKDWDSLFAAIEERLTGVVTLTEAPSNAIESADKIRAAVLDCVESMKQLHTALKWSGREERSAQAGGEPCMSPRPSPGNRNDSRY
jgi:hypothetical protein